MTALHRAAVGQDSARESFNGLTHGVSRQPLSAIEQAHHHDDAALTSGNATASPDADLTGFQFQQNRYCFDHGAVDRQLKLYAQQAGVAGKVMHRDAIAVLPDSTCATCLQGDVEPYLLQSGRINQAGLLPEKA